MNVRESILTAGVALLKDKGITALTQPQVATAAGVKQSHLTYYFPTRTDLLLGIAERSVTATLDDLALRLVSSPPDRPPPAALAATLAEAISNGVPPRIIIGLIVAADAEPNIHKHLRRLVKQIRRHIHVLLIKAGLDADPDAALVFHATVVGLAVMHQARMNAESKREVSAGIGALICLLGPNRQPSQMGA